MIHFHTMIAGEALRLSGISISETLAFTSPIYMLELSVIGRLFAQNPDLYAEIEMSNPESENVRKLLLNAANDINNIISSNDREAFRTRFLQLREYFDDFTEEAMMLSDQIIETLMSQP